MDRPIRTLLFSTLYPSNVRPSHGIFVETRLRHLLASGEQNRARGVTTKQKLLCLIV